jgi:hypothetical protein
MVLICTQLISSQLQTHSRYIDVARTCTTENTCHVIATLSCVNLTCSRTLRASCMATVRARTQRKHCSSTVGRVCVAGIT